jgi:hypothetical protein
MERIPDVLARLRLELERGRLDVARGRDGRSALDEVRRGSSGMKLGAMSPLGIEIAELARLVEGPPGRERPGGASA